MTTKDLIELLQSVEKGGVTGEYREISITLPDDSYLSSPDIEIDSTGDGIAGAELTLRLSSHEE